MSSKRRVYEVARDLGMDNKAFVALLETLGVREIKNHMSVLTPEAEERVKRHLGKSTASEAVPEPSAEERIHPAVVKRRAVVRRKKAADGSTEELSAEAVSQTTPLTENEQVQPAASVQEPAAVAGETPVQAEVVVPALSEPEAPAQPVAAGASSEAEPAPVASASTAEVQAASPVEPSVEVPAAAAETPAAPEPAAAREEAASSEQASQQAEQVQAQEPAAPAQAPSPVSGTTVTNQEKLVASEERQAPAAPSAVLPAAAEKEQLPPVVIPRPPHVPGTGNRPQRPGEARPVEARSVGSRPAAESRPAAGPARPASAAGPASAPARPGSAPARPSVLPSARPSSPPKTGIDVWEGRPGVPMHHHRPGPRRVQYDAKAAGPGGVRRGPGGGPPSHGPANTGPVIGGPGGRMMRGKPRGMGGFNRPRNSGPPVSVTKERSAHKKVVRIEENVALQGLAGSMGVKATDLLRKLLQLGMTGININSTLDADTAKIVAEEFGWDVEDVAVSEEEQLQKAQGIERDEDADEGALPRPPVVTVMGHVDHGKTSLLDALRRTNTASGEAGGITQHIGAYSVDTPHGKVTFLDTPGHAAFAAMRARGAQATDLVVLVVAADDGVMPQTKEAISHAKAAKVPIVVAINKCDKPDAQPERIRRELSEQGLVPEEWGGDTLFCEISAKTKLGIDELLEKLALQAEVMELRASPDKPASGLVVESQLDRGRGPVATVLVTEGTLHLGDVILAGAGYGKVRAMLDWEGRNLREVGPSGPAAIVGLSEVPRAGDQVYVVKDLKTAQSIAETRKVKERRSLAPSAGNKPRTLEEIARLMSEQEQLELKVIIKADVAGSAEAVSDSLMQLSTDKVRVSVVLQAAGAITENDVNLAVAAGAIIVGFNVKPAGKAQAVAQREGIEIRQYTIIYNLLDDVKLAMEGLLAPKLVEKDIGKAEVRQTFRITKSGTVAGSMVIEGAIRRGAGARLIREGVQIWEGKISGLKRFKDDAREVKEGFECGISLEGMNEIHVGDVISAFEIEEIKQSL